MTNFRNGMISSSLTALVLAGCGASMPGVKEEAPAKTETTSPVDDGISAKLTPINGIYQNLGPEEHLTVQYLSSPLDPLNVKAMVKHYSECTMDAVWDKTVVPDQVYTCWGSVDHNGYYAPHECDPALPEQWEEILELGLRYYGE